MKTRKLLLTAVIGILITCSGLYLVTTLPAQPPAAQPAQSTTAAPSPTLNPTPTIRYAPTFAEIAGNSQTMTDAQWNRYAASLQGAFVNGWPGIVTEVNEGELLGGFDVHVDVSDSSPGFDVSIPVSENVALSLNKGQHVTVSGNIAAVVQFMGLIISLEEENATIKAGEP